MLTIYSDDHHLHHGKHELIGGQFKPCFEMPSRADMVLDRAKAVAL
ncbi:MAG: histone deacetylase family protein, partial [Pseudomonas sp.]